MEVECAQQGCGFCRASLARRAIRREVITDLALIEPDRALDIYPMWKHVFWAQVAIVGVTTPLWVMLLAYALGFL